MEEVARDEGDHEVQEVHADLVVHVGRVDHEEVHEVVHGEGRVVVVAALFYKNCCV